MQPLATTLQMMMWLCMCPVDDTTTRRQHFAYVAHTLAILIICLIGITTGLAYCITFISIDFDGAVFGFMAAIAEFGIIYALIAAIKMRHEIEHIFTGLSSIYKSSKFQFYGHLNIFVDERFWNDPFTDENQVTFRYLVRANSTSERICAFYLKYVVVILIAAAITSVLSVCFGYVTQGKLDFDRLYRPAKFLYAFGNSICYASLTLLGTHFIQLNHFHFSFPWNQATFAGYSAEICMTISIGYAYFALIGTQMLLFISLCIHHQAFYKMFKHSTDKSEKCDAKLLRDLICFNISTKE